MVATLIEHAVSKRERVARWWHRSGQMALGLGMMLLAGALAFVALSLAATAADVEKSATINCQRARAFGPVTYADWTARHVSTPAVRAAYLATIPKTCPGDDDRTATSPLP